MDNNTKKDNIFCEHNVIEICYTNNNKAKGGIYYVYGGDFLTKYTLMNRIVFLS